jgi:hypothetical protein
MEFLILWSRIIFFGELFRDVNEGKTPAFKTAKFVRSDFFLC